MVRFAATLAAVLLVLASPAAAGVTSPQSGWYAGNPLLGPNDLSEVACSGQTCYAAGGFGTLLRSTDGGATWQGARTGLIQTLQRVRIVGGDARTLVTAGRCLLRRSGDGGMRFTRLPLAGSDASCTVQIAAVAFPTAERGFVLFADRTVSRTDDGGRHFTAKAALPPADALDPNISATDIACASATRCVAVNRGGAIWRTDDGGDSWKVVGSGKGFNAVAFADANTGYAVGLQLTVMKTTDGGATWTPMPVKGMPDDALTAASCASPDVCLFATSSGTRFIRTNDGGSTYTSIPTFGRPHTVAFASPTRAVAAGGAGFIETSDDAGVSWRAAGAQVPGEFRVLRAVNGATAFAAGTHGAVARTTDAGQSWTAANVPTDSDARDVAAADSRTVYVLDRRNRLQRSSDGGQTWTDISPGAPQAYALATLPGGRVLLVGRHSASLSADDGDSFARVKLELVRGDSLSAVDRAGAATLAYGPRTLVVSSDNARHWRHVRLPRMAKGDAINRVDFVAPRVGYLLSAQRRLFATSDAGHHWREIVSTGGGGADMAFSDRLHGFLAVPGYAYRYSGAVLRTSNGGVTWHPQIVGPGFLPAVDVRGSTAFALTAPVGATGGAGGLYATKSGGDAGEPSLVTLRPSARKVKRGGRVTLKGRLSPAGMRKQVVVSGRGAGRWITRVVPVGKRGAWRSVWKLNRTTVFVAQVLGDDRYAGAGSRPVVVAVRR